MKRFTSLPLGAATLVAALAIPGTAAQTGTIAELSDRIHEGFAVSDYTVQRLEVPASITQGFTANVDLGGRVEVIVARPYSVRGLDFEVLVDRGDDQLEAVDVGAPTTFRGSLGGVDGSVVAGSLSNGRLQALIMAGDGSTWAIQPLDEIEPNTDAALHVVYDVSDTMPGDWTCIEVETNELEERGGAILGTGKRWCEIAFDCDVEFFNANSGSVTNTVNDVELVMGLVNVIYERDVDIIFDITAIIVRTSEPDPYSTTDPSALLNQFRGHWSSTKSFIKRDTAHLMTGKNLAGSVIGIAYLSVICSQSSGFGVSQSRFSFNLGLRAGLTAHEVGHNYSAPHCSGSGCFIMCPSIGGCGGDVTKFGTIEQNQIQNYSAGRPCTPELAPPLAVPFTDDFEGALDGGIWPTVQGAVTSTAATGETSGVNSLHLDTASAEDFGDDMVRSNYIPMSGLSGMSLAFNTEHVGVEAGETLVVEYLASNGDWVAAVTVVSDGANQATFESHSFNLPANAYHDGFRVGIRVAGTTTDDEWYVDDFGVVTGCPQPVNYCSTAPNSVGSGGLMTFTGTTSVATNDLHLIAYLCPPGQFGVFFHGPNQTQTPFGNGFMCISGGVTRLPLQTIDIFGEAGIDFDVTGTGINAGDDRNFQFWYRDPMGGGAFFNLTDGLATTWCP